MPETPVHDCLGRGEEQAVRRGFGRGRHVVKDVGEQVGAHTTTALPIPAEDAYEPRVERERGEVAEQPCEPQRAMLHGDGERPSNLRLERPDSARQRRGGMRVEGMRVEGISYA